ncbi:hypothetical protein, partial [Shewanella sp.]|uniref:hypothetical protein n=1 Tax=Shewanella sp. TaxID=50422 RepID=UPI003D1007FB
QSNPASVPPKNGDVLSNPLLFLPNNLSLIKVPQIPGVMGGFIVWCRTVRYKMNSTNETVHRIVDETVTSGRGAIIHRNN